MPKEMTSTPFKSVAVLIPCFNEEASIGKVVRDFALMLPRARVYVYDNNSTDDTVAVAQAANAVLRHETQQGKGHVIRRMFRDIDADFYLLVDGDDTYDPALGPLMVEIAQTKSVDLVNCVRKEAAAAAYRTGHRWGNLILTSFVRSLFGNRVEDMLSGYKVVSRRFVKSFPALAHGFDIETEITVHALELSMPVAHVHGNYRPRPPGSTSKLRTYRDGWRILMMILRLIRHERPFLFFAVIAALLAALSMAIFIPVLTFYLETGRVPRLPSAVLSTAIMIVAALSLLAGTILDTVTRGRREVRLLAYLANSGVTPEH